MIYKYTAFNKDGKKIKGKIEALNEKDARNKIDGIVISIKPAKSFNIHISNVSKTELFKLFNALGLYLKASISLINAITLTKNQTDNVKLLKFLDYLQQNIKEGQSFYKTLLNQKIIKIPSYIINSVKVGEETGKLDSVLIEMSKFLKEEEKINSKTKQALIYPSFIVIVAIAMIVFMLTNVVPKIVKVFQNMHQKLPSVTEFVINTGNFLKNNYLTLLIVTVLSVLIYLFLYKKSQKFKYFIHSLLLKIPLVKKIIISKELGRFSYLTYVLTSSGVNYVNAVNLAANTIENEKIKSVFKKALNEVIEGKKLSYSLKKAGFDFDKSFIQAIALAEETSEMDNILKNLSEIYFEENESRINTFLSILEPALIIIIGGVIGFIITALLLPMFNMNVLR
jgi:general secretion pathway protein F/type IV pilus assembly protein PilC